MRPVHAFFIFLVLNLIILAGPLLGTIIDTINAMPDNSWLRLPENGTKPMNRSSSNCMHYDGDSLGYMWGCSHAKHNNDLWAFNLSANRWREALPTEPSVMTDPQVIKVKDSILMTREERPLSAHQWSNMDFDTDQKKLWLFSYGWWQGLYSGHGDTVCKYYPGPGCNARTNRKVMGRYDPVTNKWEPVKFSTTWPLTCTTCGSCVFRYIPYLKKFVCFIFGVYNDRFVLMDPVNLTMQTVNVTLEPILGDNGTSGSGMLGGAVWDSFREVLIFAGRGNTGTWAFDPKTMTMKQIVTVAGSPCVWTDCATSHMVYDSGNRSTLIFTTPGMQECYGGGTWPSRSAVYVLDYENNKWDLLPAPSSGESPTSTSNASCVHSYFDQKLGVIFLFEGGYDRTNGVKWIYKYKTPAGSIIHAAAPAPVSEWIRVVPSPVSGLAFIQVMMGRSALERAAVYDVHGRLVSHIPGFKSRIGRHEAVFNTEGMANGIYILRIQTKGRILSKKFLVQH